MSECTYLFSLIQLRRAVGAATGGVDGVIGEFSVLVRPDMLVVEVIGRCDDTLLAAIVAAVRRSEPCQSGIGIVVDLSKVVYVRLSPGAVQEAIVGGASETQRIAIVASAAAILAMANIFHVLTHPLNSSHILLVNELVTAVNWLRARPHSEKRRAEGSENIS